MATGSLIRDFFKENRELQYSNSGSIGISEIEHNAYRLSLTLEITDVDAPRYSNLKTLPENTHWGYVTLFRGSAVAKTIQIKYPKQRIFDINNQGIWNYHQMTETTQILAGAVEASDNEQSTFFVAVPGFITGDTCRTLRFLFPSDNPVDTFILNVAECDAPGDPDTRRLVTQYRGFPVATPFPDIAKFKSDVPCSFLWRLESWYLVNPAIYIADNPSDAGDQTEGESEYLEPEQGDGDGDGSEFPTPSPQDPDRDPRDYNGGQLLPGQGYVITFDVSADPGGCRPGQVYRSQSYGPFANFGPAVGTAPGNPNPACPGTSLGFRIVFEDGTQSAVIEDGAGVYSATIAEQTIV